MTERLVNICRFFVRPKETGSNGYWPTDYIPHMRDEALLSDRRPRIKFLRDHLGISVTAAARDKAWNRAKFLGNSILPGKKYRQIIFDYYFEDR